MISSKEYQDKIEELSSISKKMSFAVNNFDERFIWLAEKGIISIDISRTIRNLHEYRNQYLHRLKRKENDSIAFAKLYFYLFQQLFLGIPVPYYSSTDADNSEIVRKVIDEKCFSLSNDKFKLRLIECLNSKYEISFSINEFLTILQSFLLDKYNDIVEALHFIIESVKDKHKAIDFLEKKYHTGKITMCSSTNSDDSFTCTSSKTQQILGDIRKLSLAENEHIGLQKFNQLYCTVVEFERPIFEEANRIEEYIQLQVDIMRGK